jgi:hypothetical protein
MLENWETISSTKRVILIVFDTTWQKKRVVEFPENSSDFLKEPEQLPRLRSLTVISAPDCTVKSQPPGITR